jgi:Ankyrin repeats (3 copies)
MSTTPHTPPSPPNADRDSLVASYHAAQNTLADNSAAPSPQVHTNVMAYAQQLAQARASQASIAPSTAVADKHIASANDGQWKIRAMASVALFGFCSLLLMQWDRAAPEEKQVALSTQAPALDTPAAPKPVSAAPELSTPSNAAPPPVLSAESTKPAIAGATQSPNTDAANVRARLATPQPNAAQDAPAEAKVIASKPESRLESVASAPVADNEMLRKDKSQKKAAASNAISAPAIEASPPAAAAAPAATAAATAPTMAAAPVPQAAARAAAPRMSAPAPMSASAPAQVPAPASAAAAPSPLADAASAASTETSKKSAPSAPVGATTMSLAPDASATSPALRAEDAALFSAIRNKDAAALQQALANGANKDIRRNGSSAVMQCVQTRQADLLKLLIAAGADVNATDAQGTTPLALSRSRGYADISELLLNAGAK